MKRGNPGLRMQRRQARRARLEAGRTRFSYQILDSREARLLEMELDDFLGGLVAELAALGVMVQSWAKDDEMVLTFSKRGRLKPADVASAVECDPSDLEEM